MFKKRKKTSVTAFQKKSRFFVKRIPFGLLICIIITCFLYYQKKSRSIFQIWSQSPYSPEYIFSRNLTSQANIKFELDPQATHYPKMKDLTEQIKLHNSSWSFKDISNLAKVLLGYDYIEKVVIKSSVNDIYLIRLTPRSVLTCLKINDSLMYLDHSGAAYGKPAQDSLCPKIFIGFHYKDLTILNNSKSILTLEEKSKFKNIRLRYLNENLHSQIRNILAALHSSTISFSDTILYDEGRGFTLKILPTGLEVIIGQEHFNKRLSSLDSILKSKNIELIKKIELDFNGKAFIKYSQADH